MWKHIVLIGGSGTLPSSWSAVQPRALPESLTPTYPHESNSPMLACYTSATPLFLFSLCLSFSLSLINVKPFNNKASILSLPAFSALHVCHCALTLPLPWPKQPPSSFHMAMEPKPQAHTAERFTGSVRRGQKKKKGKRRHLSHFDHFVWQQEKKKIFLHHLHNSWNTREKTGHLVVKKNVWVV